MLKIEERELSGSCWNNAKDEEMVFILLVQDAAAPFAVKAWIDARVRSGKNGYGDPKIQEALRWIQTVEGGRK